MSALTSPNDRAIHQESADDHVKVSFANISKSFGSKNHAVAALQDFSFDVRQGEFLAVVGPSGCGKTTLLRILGNLERQDVGTVEIARKDLDRPENSMILQGESIFPWMTIQENVEFGLRIRHVNKRERASQAEAYIEKVGLHGFANSYPHQLSGGMKQRVAIARAFANDPEILLMDEPFAALDEQTKLVLQQELLRLWESTRKTVLFITHSLDEALTLADRVLVMTARPGQISLVVDVPFARPRNVLHLRQDPHYGELINKIWDALKLPGTNTSPSEPHRDQATERGAQE